MALKVGQKVREFLIFDFYILEEVSRVVLLAYSDLGCQCFGAPEPEVVSGNTS